jgi:hypothetical protein
MEGTKFEKNSISDSCFKNSLSYFVTSWRNVKKCWNEKNRNIIGRNWQVPRVRVQKHHSKKTAFDVYLGTHPCKLLTSVQWYSGNWIQESFLLNLDCGRKVFSHILDYNFIWTIMSTILHTNIFSSSSPFFPFFLSCRQPC